MGVVALIAGVLGGTLRLASRAWERGEQQLAAGQRSRDVVDLLGQELRSAYPYQLKEGTKLVYFFQGQGGRVRFVSALSDPSPDAPALLRVVTFFVEPGQGLFVQSAPLLGGGLPEEVRGAARLLDSRVRELRLRYLAPEGWVSSWEPKAVTPAGALAGALKGQATGAATAEPVPTIPRAVEVILTFASSRLVGPLTIPVFATTELKKTNPAGGKAS